MLGFAALLLESTVPLPQLILNFRHRSCEGLRLELWGSWLAGDIYKLFYTFYYRTEIQFIVCAIIQIIFDLGIGIQIIYYAKWIRTGPCSFRLTYPKSFLETDDGEDGGGGEEQTDKEHLSDMEEGCEM